MSNKRFVQVFAPGVLAAASVLLISAGCSSKSTQANPEAGKPISPEKQAEQYRKGYAERYSGGGGGGNAPGGPPGGYRGGPPSGAMQGR